LQGGQGQVITVAGRSGFYVACGYDSAAQSATFAIVSRDPSGAWSTTATWYDQFPLAAAAPGLTLTLGPAYVVVTAVTSLDDQALTSQTRTYLWDDELRLLNSDQPFVQTHTTPVISGVPQSPAQATVAAASLAGTGADLARYVGGITGPGFDPAPYWPATSFTVPDQNAACQYAYGDDVAVLSSAGSTILLAFDPNQPAASGWTAPVTLSPGGPNPTISGDYLTAGSTLYIRRPGQGWVAVAADLPGDVDPASIQNLAPAYLVYQDTGGTAAQSYAVLLGNDGATVLGALPGGPQKVRADSAAVSGTQLAGPAAFVTYPAAGSFDTASSLTLYRVVGGAVTGSVVDHPVASVAVNSGYDEPLIQGYLYDVTTTTYDGITGIAQYTKVTSVPGVPDPGTDVSRPFGHTDHYFSNATLQQTDPFYPSGVTYNYDGLLNGVKLCEQDFDDTGMLISSTVNYWLPFESDPRDDQSMLPGAYFRRVKTVTAQDGMEPNVTDYRYDQATGLVARTTTSLHDSTGTERTFVSATTYGYQVPSYAAVLLAAHQLTTVVQRTTTVNGTATTSKVTTLRNWGTGRDYWATEDSYQWLGTGAGPVFDFAGPASPDWLLLRRVISRAAAGYQPTEVLDARGTPTSFLYDKAGSYPVARFLNASLAGNELAYADFEPYSVPLGWVAGTGTSVDATDAHTGVASLRLAPADEPGLTAELVPARQSFDYLLLAWVKTGPGFATDQGEAAWTITLGNAEGPAATAAAISVPVTDTGGGWVPVTIPIQVAAEDGRVTIGIALRNGKASAWIAVDDIRVTPLACNAGARIYDDATRLIIAATGSNADTTRTGYDAFQRRDLLAGPTDDVTSLSAAYYSRAGNADTFSPADPNLILRVWPRTGGSYDAFTRGEEWRARWRPDSRDWRVSAGRLVYQGTGPSALTATSDEAEYAVRIRLRPVGTLTGPFGLRIGSRLGVSWDPADGSVRLTGAGNEQQPVSSALFTVPLAPYQQPLDDGTVPGGLREEFAAYGCSLSDPRVTVAAQGQRWVITDSTTGAGYYLNASADQVIVSRPPYEWLLVVGATRLVAYADGRRVISYLPDPPLSGAPALVVSDPVAVDDLVLAAAPHVVAAFQDGVGNDRQGHELLGVGGIARQTCFDPLGRPAVRTKAAPVTPTAEFPLLAYRADLVTGLDWTSGVMTGLLADAYPGDEGYPYQRARYEAFPHGRVVEQGQPGKLLAIDLTTPDRHTTSYSYSTNDEITDGLPARQYHQRVTADPDGRVTSDLADRLGHPIRSATDLGAENGVLQAFVEYDVSGNAMHVRLPNYYDPPAGTAPADWVITSGYDFLGRLTTRTAPDLGQTHVIYSPAGDLRFVQESAAAEHGIYLYNTYDTLGRKLETGQLAGAWDPVKLQAIADTDPTWPPSPPTWRKRVSYDGGGRSPYQVGKPTEIQVNLGDDGTPDSVERLTYDAWGTVVRVDTVASGYDAATHSVAVTHDNQNTMTSIWSPSEPSFAPVVYQRDELSRVVSIGTADDPARYAAYTYNPGSTIATEVLGPGSAAPVTRTLSYAPPDWPTEISHVFGESSLVVDVDYTTGGIDGTGYYTGQVARLGIRRSWPDAPPDLVTELLYDPHTGSLAAARTEGEPTWSIDSAQYDANGNLRSATMGGESWTYGYGTDDRLLSVSGLADGPAAFRYDGSGHVTAAQYPDRAVTITVDQTLRRPRSAVVRAGDASTTVEFDYTRQDLRLVKRATAQEGTTATLYLRGNGSGLYPVIEKTRNAQGNETAVLNVQGASGLIAIEPAGGEPLFLLTDHQHSTRAVALGSGEVVAWYDYLPYGGVARSAEDSPVPVRYLFTGQEYDAELGFYYYRSRFYDPAIGRFYAPDEAGRVAGPYTYAANDPVSSVDPTGNVGFLAILGIVAQVIVDAVLEVVTDGAATPLVEAEVDAEASLLTTTAVTAQTAEVLDPVASTAAGGTTEAAESEGAEAAVTNAVKTEPESPPQVVDDVSKVPPDATKVGSHWTSDVFNKDFEQGLNVSRAGGNFGGESQLGEGFYTTEDERVGAEFGEQAVGGNGGKVQRYDVYVRNLADKKFAEVPDKDQWKPMPWSSGPNSRYINDFHGLRSSISGYEPVRQLKLNPNVFKNTVLVRRYSTFAGRATFFRPTPAFANSQRLVSAVRVFL
jgi:RHS repeat-associated protein